MPVIRYKGVEYGGPSVHIQSDATATDLENTSVPNGQTIKSYLNSNIGVFYTATWKATTSTATGTVLTNDLTLPKGKYIIHGQLPTVSNTSSLYGISATSGTIVKPVTELYWGSQTYGQLVTSIEVTTSTAVVVLKTGSSGTVNFTTTGRGYLRAIRVA